MWSLATVTAPAEEPITLAEAKKHLRVEHTADDDLIAMWIASARLITETHAGRRWVTQTVRYTADGFPRNGCPVRLPVSPISAVNSVSYRDSSGTLVTAETGDWQAWADHNPPLIAMSPGEDWFATQDGALAAVTIEVVAGYGGAVDVPANAKAAILLCLGYWYENRGDDSRLTVPENLGMPIGAVRLLAGLNTGSYL